MKLQSTKNRSPRMYVSNKNSVGARNINRSAGIVVTLIFFCIGFALVLIGHLHLCQLSLRASENSVKIEKQITRVQQETLNFRNRCAALNGWKHIQKKMQTFNLNLIPAAPGQIINIGIYTPRQAAAIPLKPLSVASRETAKSAKPRKRRQ